MYYVEYGWELRAGSYFAIYKINLILLHDILFSAKVMTGADQVDLFILND